MIYQSNSLTSNYRLVIMCCSIVVNSTDHCSVERGLLHFQHTVGISVEVKWWEDINKALLFFFLNLHLQLSLISLIFWCFLFEIPWYCHFALSSLSWHMNCCEILSVIMFHRGSPWPYQHWIISIALQSHQLLVAATCLSRFMLH